MVVSPCKDCGDRVVSCHSTCDRYKGWRAELDQERENVLKYKSVTQELYQRKKEAMKKFWKRK